MEKVKPKVSVIITTYNRAKELAERSLPSVLRQTYNNFECIVVDDASTDETPKIIEDFIRRGVDIKYLRLKENKGLAAARNYGVSHAKGEFIVFLDDDNELSPKFLEITVKKLSQLPKEFAAVCVGRIIRHKKSEEYAIPDLEKYFYQSIDWGWLLRREVFDKIKYDEELRADEDADFGIQFFKYYKAYAIDEPLTIAYTYLLSPSSSPSISLPTKERLNSLDRFLRKNLSIYKQKGTREELAFIYRFAGSKFCLGKQMKKGGALLLKSFLTKPSLRTFLNLIAAFLGWRVYSFYHLKIERNLIRLIRSLLSMKYLKKK
jgi:glycosyltransferase involved in cell wall biosynthesis